MKSQSSNYSSEKSERLEARLSRRQKAVFQHAADLTGRSFTDFIISALQEAANKVIREHEVISLTAQESKKFADVLLNPPKPNAALKKAAKRHQNFLDEKS